MGDVEAKVDIWIGGGTGRLVVRFEDGHTYYVDSDRLRERLEALKEEHCSECGQVLPKCKGGDC